MKGILFKPDMIKAIVEGRKTVTRRVIKPQPEKLGDIYKDASMCYRQEGAALIWQDGFAITKSRYQPNEVVYIKEAANVYDDTADWQIRYSDDSIVRAIPPEEWIAKHYADFLVPYTARTLPAWAARYFIKIKDVRAERLQEITEEDALNEGVNKQIASQLGLSAPESQEEFNFTYARRTFQQLWNSINKPPYDWQSNPWVWRYEFEPHPSNS